MPARPFRFGVQAYQAPTGAAWTAQCQQAEALGYSSLTVPDHFGDQLAPMPALAAAAGCTKALKLGALVFANDFKHPVVLAKEASTLDLLSGGRLELGLGAGWLGAEYEQAGMPFDKAGVRIDRMLEGLAIIKGLMRPEPFSFEGRHYKVSNLEGRPMPVQRPHPPIIIGGGGKRMLTVAAQNADIVGIIPDLRGGKLDSDVVMGPANDTTAEKVGWVREAAGDRYSQIELNILIFFAVDPTPGPVRQQAAAQMGTSPEALLKTPHVLIGSVEEIVDVLQMRRDQYDLSYIIVGAPFMQRFAPVVARLAGT